MAKVRIGQGYDVHAFCEGSYIILGGVKIPFKRGISAHSDGDVLTHSICDAMLGALALGDVGQHFPDTDPQYKSINSRRLLCQVVDIVKQQGYTASNVDATIVAQEPRLEPFVARMRTNIASDIGCPEDCVSIKATTTEGLGFSGRQEGLESHSVVLLEQVTE